MKHYSKFKPLVIFFLLFTPIFNLHAQTEQEQEIEVIFATDNDTTILRTIKADDSEIFEFDVNCKALIRDIDKDYKMIPKLDSITTKNGDVELLTDYLFFPSNELQSEDNIYTQKIKVKVNPDSTDKIKVFRLTITGESVDFNSEKHTLIVTISTKEKNAENAEFMRLMALTDTTKVGTIYLTEYTDIPIYTKIKLKDREKVETDIHRPCRERLFMKRYEKKNASIDIEEVKIVIENGQISNIEVRIKEGTGIYSNKGPISLTNYNKKHDYALHYSGSDLTLENTYIRAIDFLNYIHAEGRQYFPSSDNFQLKPKPDSTSKILSYIGNPNSYFDVRAYTDTKGLSGEENGLVQTEVSANFIANSNNLGRSYLSLAKFINVGLSWSKFDSQFDTLNITSYETREDFELLHLLQQSNTAMHVEIDLLHRSRVHDAFFTVGHRIYNTRLKDTSGVFKRAFTPSFYAFVGGTIYASPRVNAKFKLPLNASYVHDQPFTDYGRKWNWFIAPEIEFTLQLKKSSEGDKNQRSFVFGRIRYFDMPLVSGGNYWQIQTGVEIPFSSLFGKD